MSDNDFLRRQDAMFCFDDDMTAYQARQAIAALPAVSAPVAVRVKPLQFRDELGDGVLTSRETGELFRIFPQTNGGFCAPKLPEPELYADDAQTLIDRLNARWAARIMAAVSAPDVAELVEALRGLHHAVCGETGFAACVRQDSGKAYPWPALDAAEEAARAALARIGGQ